MNTVILFFLLLGLLGQCSASNTFGHSLLPYFFHNYTQFNHGAYGGTPVPVINAQFEYVATMESEIDVWMNGATGYRQCIDKARQALTNITKAPDANDTVLVDNATEGINVILRTLEPPLGPDQYIFDLSTEYSPFIGLYKWIEARYGTKVITADIVFPVTGTSSFVDPVRAVLETNRSSLNIRIAVISHVSAYPSVVLPVRELVELFHSYGIPVIVDGAHALGNIDINIAAMGNPDYYFANAHKWLFAPKSVAVLYVRHDHQLVHVPAPMLIDSDETQAFTDRFIWCGTRDRSAYCAIQDALAFRQTLGGEAAVMKYTQQLAQEGAKLLVNMWQSRLLGPVDMMSSMISIQVPTDSLSVCQTLRSQLCTNYDICVSASVSYTVAGSDIACYWRLSAQVYLEIEDYNTLGVLTLQLLKEMNALKTAPELGFEYAPL